MGDQLGIQLFITLQLILVFIHYPFPANPLHIIHLHTLIFFAFSLLIQPIPLLMVVIFSQIRCSTFTFIYIVFTIGSQRNHSESDLCRAGATSMIREREGERGGTRCRLCGDVRSRIHMLRVNIIIVLKVKPTRHAFEDHNSVNPSFTPALL